MNFIEIMNKEVILLYVTKTQLYNNSESKHSYFIHRMTIMPAKPKIKHIYTKVVGVTRGNRQSVISKCEIGELLLLDHEENNPVDPNAIKVLTQKHKELGYLNANLAKNIVDKSEQKYNVSAIVTDVTGGTFDKKSFGCNIVLILSKNADTATVQKYFDNKIAPDVQERIDTHNSKKNSKGYLIPLLFFCLIYLLWCLS